MIISKTCPKCNQEKTIDNFYPHKTRKYRIYCKQCEYLLLKERHEKRKLRTEIAIPEFKTCPQCKINKSSSDFSRSVVMASGLETYCKQCKSFLSKERRKRKLLKTVTIPEFKPCGSCKKIKPNSEFVKDRGANDGLSSSCRTCAAACQKKWQYKYREKTNARARARRAVDPEFKISNSIRHRIRMFLSGKTKKSQSTIEIIGASFKECMDRLESLWWPGMTWRNYGKGGWVVDHIIPLSNFNILDPEQMKTAFNYKNMQPLWEDDNRNKWDYLDWTPTKSKHELPERLKHYLAPVLPKSPTLQDQSTVTV